MTEAPPSPTIGVKSIETLRLRSDQDELAIDRWTLTPDWDGKPMDLDWVMAVILDNVGRGSVPPSGIGP